MNVSLKFPKLEYITCRWLHCPITALCFASQSSLFIARANFLECRDVTSTEITWSYQFLPHVTIHEIAYGTCNDPSFSVLAIAGSRFFAILASRKSPNHFVNVLCDYRCDNIIVCKIQSNQQCIWIMSLSAHGEIRLHRLTLERGSFSVQSSFTQADQMMLYSGYICFFHSQNDGQLISFQGSTFGHIQVRQHQWYLDDNCALRLQLNSRQTTLECQKGAIFSISYVHLKSMNCLRLCTAAEDRSIAIWNKPLTDGCSQLTASSLIDKWIVLLLLNSGPCCNILFEARIWKVVATDRGIIASGEDCRVVWYTWENMNTGYELNRAHRGRSIWALDAMVEDSSEFPIMVASGGNDGAVYIHRLPHKPDHPSCACEIETRPNMLTKQTKPKKADIDFPRCIFFGPDGRVFYLTDAGHIFSTTLEDAVDGIATSIRINPPLSFPQESGNSVDKQRNATEASSPSTWTFSGHTVSSTNRSHSLVAIGDKQGRLGVYHLLPEYPYLTCINFWQLDCKIMRHIWTTEDWLLVGTQGGFAILMDPTKVKQPHLQLNFPQESTMRWANAACTVDLPCQSVCTRILVIGTRDGGLYTYPHQPPSSVGPTTIEPLWRLECCHGRGGCTSVCKVPNATYPCVLSCGRTHGEIRLWSVEPVDGSLRLAALIPSSDTLSWVERLTFTSDGKLLVLGFHSDDFKVYPLSQQSHSNDMRQLVSFEHLSGAAYTEIACGGGNHCWDFWLSPNRSAILGFISRGKVMLKSTTLCERIVSIPRSLLLIRPALHGRDINCCLLFRTPNKPPGTPSGCTFFCFAGSEDTCLSSWTLRSDAQIISKGTFEQGDIEHHRGHISNIRCMNTPVDSLRANHRTTPSFILSGGGRGQLGLWSLSWSLSDNLWRPGWLGSVRLRQSSTTTACVSVMRRVRHSDTSQADLRIMALVSVQESLDPVTLITVAACSDGSLRLLRIDPPNQEHPHYARFSELASSASLPNAQRHCYLDLQLIKVNTESLTAVATTTSGTVECWTVDWTEDAGQRCFEHQWTLSVESVGQLHTQSKPACNCIDVSPSADRFVVGTDDGAIRVANVSNVSLPNWTAYSLGHHSAVLRTKWIVRSQSHLSIISLASDQRLITWRLTTVGDKSHLQPVKCVLLSGVGDPHGLSISQTISEHVDDQTLWALVTGVGVTLLPIL